MITHWFCTFISTSSFIYVLLIWSFRFDLLIFLINFSIIIFIFITINHIISIKRKKTLFFGHFHLKFSLRVFLSFCLIFVFILSLVLLVKVLLIKKRVFCCLDQLFITQWQVLLDHEETSPAYFVENLLHTLRPYSYPFLVKSNNNSNKFRTCCSIEGATKLQTKIIIVSAPKIGESTTKIISCFSQKN